MEQVEDLVVRTIAAATLAQRVEAYGRLVEQFRDMACGYAYSILGDFHLAEDVAQEAFVVAIERIEECREPERFAGWLMTIVRNRSRNLRGAMPARRSVPWEDDTLADGMRVPDALEDAERREDAERLLEGLAGVSEVQRQVVLLHDLEGWRHAEIGASLGLSEGMSRQHLFAAHRLLRERLAGSGLPGGSHGF